MSKIADIIDIPEQVHQGDFVLKLTEGVREAASTLDTYVVTPQLVNCFDQALRLIQSAVETNRSMGAYLHGSFGSGKSHFMAVLSLLLQGNPTARAVPELAAVVSRHNSWTEGKRFLEVPYHLIGAISLESAILGQYAAFVRTRHPEAPTPGFYRAEKIFEDARRLREQMGNDVFFEKLGSAAGATDSGWGALDSAWDAESFEAALASEPGTAERARLVGDLVDSFFGAHKELAAGQEEGFVPLDEGLVILARHAQDLGYDAVVLFLDELVLWLASHAADPAWVTREGQKVAKLVEAAQMDRAVPIISFIARQRDLRELVGEHLPGAEQIGFSEVLDWWQARFETITLEDRNLPAIVERRLLKPKSPAAKQQLHQAFEEIDVQGDVLSTLLTREGDREMFRQVYPFSPALVHTLIAVSSLLQRERTALKLLLQLLVDQRDTLALGDLVPVGDLYDVIAAGDEPFSQAMKQRFDQAKQLYQGKLVPLLETEYSVSREEVAAGQAAAGVAEAFRNDARLMKTLILSALADEVEALKALTPARLAALNHGTVRSPIPGQESQMVLTKVRKWAAQVGEIKVADDTHNPVISLHLVGVDTEGILENAKAFDSHGNRVHKIRGMLYEMAGIPKEDSLLPPKHHILWRGTARTCEILFRNVRELPLDQFAPQDAAWRVVIDYPFDQPTYTPRYDLAKVQEYQQHEDPIPTLVWIPAFMTPQALDELGRLVVLDHVLSGNRLDEYGGYLSQLDREQARVILVNQRDQIRQRVKNALLAVYGISTLNREAVDTANELETNVYALDPGLTLQPPVGAGFQDALGNLFEQALRHQYSGHPEFTTEVKAAGLRRVLEVVRRAAGSADRRVAVDRPDREYLLQIAVPLKLGRMGEAHFVLDDEWQRAFEQQRMRGNVETPTVRQMRAWIDDPQPRGLPTDVENLLIITYALQTNRSFYHHGVVIEPDLSLHNDVELREQSLPDGPIWDTALTRAQEVLDVTVPSYRSANHVAKLVEETQKVARTHEDALKQYAQTLKARLLSLGMEATTVPRLETAEAAYTLAAATASAKPSSVVETIAGAVIETSASAMGTVFKRAAKLSDVIDRMQVDLLKAVQEIPEPYYSQAAAVLDRLQDALCQDEHVTSLGPVVRDTEQAVIGVLREAAQKPKSPGEGPTSPPEHPTTQAPGDAGTEQDGQGMVTQPVTGRERTRTTEVEDVLARIREEAEQSPDAWIEVTWRIEPES